MPQNSNWVFTLNNPEELLDFSDFPNIRYAIYSEEVGLEGTYHFQGYVELKKARALSAMRKLLPEAHWEVRRGSAEQAIAYCSKISDTTFVDGPHEYGDRKSQGSRSDLIEIKSKLDSNVPETQIADEHFGSWIRYHKSFREYSFLKATGLRGIPEVLVLYGGTGFGKSHWCMEEHPNAFWKARPSSKNTNIWWDGYTGQDTIILDEFYGWLPFDLVLRLCDQHPLMGEIKGGTVWLVPKTIIFTSNTHPEGWWKVGTYSSFTRRVTKWMHWTAYKTYYETDDYVNFCNSASLLRSS